MANWWDNFQHQMTQGSAPDPHAWYSGLPGFPGYHNPFDQIQRGLNEWFPPQTDPSPGGVANRVPNPGAAALDYYSQGGSPDPAPEPPKAPEKPAVDQNALFMQDYYNKMSQYQAAQNDLANRRFAWEQQQAQATEQRQHERDVSGAYQNYYDHILSYMGAHPVTGAAVGAGYLPYNGSNYAQRAPVDPLVLEYYHQHPELGQAPGEGPVGVGYHGAGSLGNNMMQMVQPMGNTKSAQQPTNQIGVNMPQFMYGLTTADGTPVPLGPQQEAQLQSSKENANAFNDYVGNYAGFDPSSLLAQSSYGGLGQIAQKNLSEPTNFGG